MKVLLIAGGWSSERDVSLAAVDGLKAALLELGHEVTFFDLLTDFSSLLTAASSHDFAYLNLHGSPGEDGMVQAMLESVGCPYVGAGPAGSFLALNKACAKEIFRFHNIPTADWAFLATKPEADWEPPFPYPVFVKSNLGGSSLHLGRAQNKEELHALFADIFAAGAGALVEPQLIGQEVTCAVVGEEALPPILVVPHAGDYFDYTSKYATGGASEICPAPISEEATKQVQALTIKACNALGLDGYGRADFILAKDGSLNILEVNTLPGFTPASLVPKAAAAVGMSMADIVDRLIQLGLSRAAKRK